MTFADEIKSVSDVDIEMKLRFSYQQLVTLAMLATAVTAVKAGDNELTLNDGIKYLSNDDVVMKLGCSCQQLVTAVKAVNSL